MIATDLREPTSSRASLLNQGWANGSRPVHREFAPKAPRLISKVEKKIDAAGRASP
jgi:hypothetical protein